MSRRLLYSIALGVAAIFVVTWWIGSVPARVTVINQSSSTLREVTVKAGRRTLEIGTLRSGEARSLQVGTGSEIELRFRGQRVVRWRSELPLSPGQPLVIYVTPDERVDVRTRIGTLSR